MIRKLLRSAKFFAFAPIVAAFIYPDLGVFFKDYLYLILFTMMFVPFLRLQTPKITGNINFGLRMFFYQYIIYFIVSYFLTFFLSEPMYKTGIILMAAMPPAVAIIGYAQLMKADTEKAVFSELFLYLCSLFVAPLMIWFFYREIVSIYGIIKVIFILLVLPFLLSRPFYNKLKWDLNEVLNIASGLGIYTAVALNVDKLINDWHALLPLFVVLILLRFALGLAIFKYAQFMKIPKKESILYILFGVSKNANLALGFALLLFSPLAAVPFAITAITNSLFVAYLFWLYE